MANSARGEGGDAHESVLGVGAALWRRKGWILVPTLLAFCASLAFVMVARPRYMGEARVLLENRETVYSRATQDTRTDPAIDPEAVASQVQNVLSRDLAVKVVREMSLTSLPEFDPAGHPSLVGKVMQMMLGEGGKSAEDRALEVYFKRLLVYPQGKSRVISIEFQSEDPKLAAEIANRVAAEYLLREEGAKSANSKSSSEWLDRAIEPLLRKVQAAEAKVEAFRAAKGLFLGSAGTTITGQQLVEMNTQLSNARAQQADLTARARLIREAVRLGRIFETSEVNNNELVRRLLEQRAGLKAQIALEERTLLPGHPRMRELAAQLGDLEGQVRAAAERAARALENDSRVAGARVASVQAEIDSQKKSAALSNEDEVQLKALERDATSLREQLNSYRAKFLDAAARTGESAHPADARIISRAFAASEPTFPKKVPIVLLATLGTLALTSTLVATNALMARAGAASLAPPAGMVDPYGYGPVPVAAAPESTPEVAPVVAAPPQPPPLFAPVSPAAPQPGAAEVMAATEAAYPPAEDLARELAMMDIHGTGRIVMVFSLENDSRAALASLRFARRLARDGAAAVLDLTGQGFEQTGGNLYSRLLPAGAAGLNAYLDRTAALGEVIHKDSRSQLHVIPAGGPSFQRIAGTVVREQISNLLEALRRAYSHVVVDAGTVGGSGELFAHHADIVVLMSRREPGDAYLARAVEKFEALRDAPVFVVGEGEPTTTPPAPANDSHPLAAFSRV